jgi:hypothetical protein
MKVEININADKIGEIVARELIQHRMYLRSSFEQDRPMMFHANPEEDKIEIQKHIEAMTLLLGYFATPSELKEWEDNAIWI